MLDILDRDYSFGCDANGAGSETVTVTPTTFAIVNVVGEVSGGNPRWRILVNGTLSTVGRGPEIDVGPLLLHPSDRLTVSLTGATPNASVVGKFRGSHGDSAAEVARNYTPGPNTITVETISTRQPLTLAPGQASLVVGTNTSNQVALQLQTGTQAIALLVDVPGNISGINLIGNVTGQDYAANIVTAGASLGNQQQFRFPIESAWDTTITLKITTNASGGATAWASAVLDPEVTWQASQEPIGAQVLAYNQHQIGYEDNVTPGGSLGASLLVSMVRAHPAPWQAPNVQGIPLNFQLNAGASGTLQAGVAGKQLRMFGMAYLPGGVVAGSSLHYRTTTGPTDFYVDDTSQGGYRTYDGDGGIIGVTGDALIVTNIGGANGPFILGGMGVSQS